MGFEKPVEAQWLSETLLHVIAAFGTPFMTALVVLNPLNLPLPQI
jgi:hypothetical protein